MPQSATKSSRQRYKAPSKGWEAEELVAAALRKQQWSLLARNFRHVGFEIDIVAIKSETLIAVEVKCRKSKPTNDYEARGLITPQKKKALERGLSAAASCFGFKAKTLRADLALVTPSRLGYPEINYYVNIL